MLTRRYLLRVFAILFALWVRGITSAAENPYLGAWELTLPGGAGWLGVEENAGRLQASMMWVAGSVEPVASAKIDGSQLILTREHSFERKVGGNNVKKTITETITATLEGERLKGTSVKPRESGSGEDRVEFTGQKSPPLPPAPDLSKIKFGPAIQLFNGKDLSGWRLTDPNAINGWSAKEGLLANNAAQEEGKPHKNFGNLRTDQEFEDFNLRLEVRCPEHGNSGIYSRGIYEAQVADSYGQPPNTHNIGAIYSRIQPTSNPSKPAGQWQSFDLTFVDRHATVSINGTKVISNQPIAGCTGGALWSDVTRPGPIYLQGDHTAVEYRNLFLRPVLK